MVRWIGRHHSHPSGGVGHDGSGCHPDDGAHPGGGVGHPGGACHCRRLPPSILPFVRAGYSSPKRLVTCSEPVHFGAGQVSAQLQESGPLTSPDLAADSAVESLLGIPHRTRSHAHRGYLTAFSTPARCVMARSRLRRRRPWCWSVVQFQERDRVGALRDQRSQCEIGRLLDGDRVGSDKPARPQEVLVLLRPVDVAIALASLLSNSSVESSAGLAGESSGVFGSGIGHLLCNQV